jgi:hypothetical protein
MASAEFSRELDPHPHWEAKRWKKDESKKKRDEPSGSTGQTARSIQSRCWLGSFVRSFIPHCAIVIHFTLNVLQNISSSSSPPARDCVTLHFLSRFFV